MHYRISWTPQLCVIFMLAMTSALAAQNFRIETELYLGESSKSSSRNVTVFSDTSIYDFLMSDTPVSEPLQITIFDRTQKKFILIDMQQKMRFELDRAQLIKLLEGLRNETMQDEASRFMADIQFLEDYDIAAGKINATSELIRYQLKGERPSDSTILPAYHEFLDHFTMLGATDPQSFPPFARLRFNQIIKKYGWIPEEVRFELNGNEAFKRTMTARTQHTVNMNLSDRDQERIELAKRCWMSYRKVSMAEFRGLPTSAQERFIDQK